MLVPVVRTERLELRGHREGDFDDCLAMWSDPRVTRHIGGRPFSSEEVWSKVLRYVGHWELLGFGYWVVVERASGKFVGEVGLANFKRDLDPTVHDVRGVPEAGWVLAPWSYGRGFATEATRAALAWGEERFGPGLASRTVCIIDPANVDSIRVASKCGYRDRVTTTYKGSAVLLFTRASFAGTP